MASALLVAASACAPKGGNGSASAPSDSIAADSSLALREQAELTPFPDTIFPSAAEVKYTIEIADSTPGNLSSLNDLYVGAPGAFTFRCGARRDADFGGRLDSVPTHF